jgi:hypothetical protein
MRNFTAVTVVLLVACGGDDSSKNNPSDAGIGPSAESGPSNGKSPNVAGCDIFPSDNAWNRDVSKDAISKDSAMYIAAMAPNSKMHPDWGTFTEQYGIPINMGTGAPPTKIDWTAKWGPTESDPLACPNNGGNFCYPIPSTAKIEGGAAAKPASDRHLLYIDTAGSAGSCTLYELYQAQNWVGPNWSAANGAIWHLGSNATRTVGWTSADAAGLPIMPGLVRYDEIKAGEIRHAIRFTMNTTQQAYILPATHAAGGSSTSDPPMGLRLRLKASVTVNKPSAEAMVIITALKKYGILLADNGSDWYISGETNDGWATPTTNGNTVMDDLLSALGQIKGSDFEVVDTGPIAGH